MLTALRIGEYIGTEATADVLEKVVNPYQVVGIIALSTLLFAAIVASLVWMGLSMLVSFLVVYVVTLWFMIGMQKRAQQSLAYREQRRSPLMRHYVGAENFYAPESIAREGSIANAFTGSSQAAFVGGSRESSSGRADPARGAVSRRVRQSLANTEPSIAVASLARTELI